MNSLITAMQDVYWGTWSARHGTEQMQNLQDMVQLIRDGRLRPGVSEAYDLNNFKDAFRSIKERHALGKVVLRMN